MLTPSGREIPALEPPTWRVEVLLSAFHWLENDFPKELTGAGDTITHAPGVARNDFAAVIGSTERWGAAGPQFTFHAVNGLVASGDAWATHAVGGSVSGAERIGGNIAGAVEGRLNDLASWLFSAPSHKTAVPVGPGGSGPQQVEVVGGRITVYNGRDIAEVVTGHLAKRLQQNPTVPAGRNMS